MESDKQINILVPAATKRKIDELINKCNAQILRAGHEAVSKRDLILTAIYKFLMGDLDWPESMEWAKKKVLIDKLVVDMKQTLEDILK